MLKPYRIAIFEDSEIDRFILESNLRLIDFPVEFFIFKNPNEGINAAQSISFDLVIINIHFWGTEYGYVIHEEFQKGIIIPPRFIAVSAFVHEKDSFNIQLRGFDAIIEKPLTLFNIQLLLDCYCKSKNSAFLPGKP